MWHCSTLLHSLSNAAFLPMCFFILLAVIKVMIDGSIDSSSRYAIKLSNPEGKFAPYGQQNEQFR